MTPMFSNLLEVLLVTLSISLLICFVRLYKGPNPPNRAVAFDLIAIHAVGIIALFAMRTEARALLDAAIITAVLGFLGTMMLAHYLERSDVEDWRFTDENVEGRQTRK
jgi:multicomponent Na+:H+ antiporter subunit F